MDKGFKTKGGKFTTDFCAVCLRKKCSFKCRGPCKRSFHAVCKDKLEAGWTSRKDYIDATFDVEELNLND